MPRHPLLHGARITSLGTLASRVLGMLRDVAMAALFGLSQGGIMDAFVTAFRIPNTFRRLFGEGALAASYLPVLTAQLQHDRHRAWQLASVVLTWVGVVLGGIVALAELACGAVWLLWGNAPGVSLLAGLTAVMMPYMLFICLAAQAAATLQALGHFSIPALAPTLLNLCWLAAVCLVAPWLPTPELQAYAVAVAVLLSGGLQLAAQLLMLRRLGFRFAYHWAAARDAVRDIARALVPMTLGLAITQVNTLVDSLIAWGLAAAPEGPQTIAWLGHALRYPLDQGAAASIYYGERLYEFPLALLGIAVATAIYPLLAGHAARQDREALAADLGLGLRLVLSLGVPAAAGLVLLAQPLARLLFERGQFTPEDTARAARVISAYATGVWAFCATPVLVRGFYALGDRATPVRLGAAMVGLNLALNLVLIWPLAEAGLALATTISGVMQAVLLLWIFSHRLPLAWNVVGKTALRALVAAAVMLAAGLLAMSLYGQAGLYSRLGAVGVPFAVSLGTYLAVFRLLGGRELQMFTRGRG